MFRPKYADMARIAIGVLVVKVCQEAPMEGFRDQVLNLERGILENERS